MRDDLRLYRRLETDAIHWDKHNRPGGSLWRAPDLDLAQALYQSKKEDFTELPERFFKASLKAAQRKKWINRALLVCFLVLGVISGIGFYFAEQSKKIAVQKQQEAEHNFALIVEKQAGFALERALKGEQPDDNFILGESAGRHQHPTYQYQC